MNRGDMVGAKYRLTRHLGAGAMGEVWAAINETTEREFAIKFVTPEIADNPEVIERMLREARAAGRVRHRNVVEVYDVGVGQDGLPFLVMELLVGESLDAYIDRVGRLSGELAAGVISDVARGLAAAHAAGVVHRDLKPANIFLHHEGEFGTVIKVVDFGVSKLFSDQSSTQTGTAIGSPAFMSPEQARGEKAVDARSDVWALGVILFLLVAGELPFFGESAFDVVAEILKGEIPRLSSRVRDVSPFVDDAVDRCLRRDRNERPSGVTELIAMLAPAAASREMVASLITPALANQLAPTLPPPSSEVVDGSLPHTLPHGIRSSNQVTAKVGQKIAMLSAGAATTAPSVAANITQPVLVKPLGGALPPVTDAESRPTPTLATPTFDQQGEDVASPVSVLDAATSTLTRDPKPAERLEEPVASRVRRTSWLWGPAVGLAIAVGGWSLARSNTKDVSPTLGNSASTTATSSSTGQLSSSASTEGASTSVTAPPPSTAASSTVSTAASVTGLAPSAAAPASARPGTRPGNGSTVPTPATKPGKGRPGVPDDPG